MRYRKKRIGPTIDEYDRQCAEAIDVEPETDGEGEDEKVNHGRTKAKAAKALADLRKAWEVPMQSWQDLYDTWPEELRAEKKAAAADRFAAEDAKADADLDVKGWTMADKRRKTAERDQP